MKERPILFSTPMVRAILGGTKTQTRRLVKPQPDAQLYPCRLALTGEQRWTKGAVKSTDFIDVVSPVVKCPYGEPGDRLWVRETWMEPLTGLYAYRADGEKPRHVELHWRPSIYMPRWASRITLEITEVRVQRLHGINADDCLAEGIAPKSDTDAPVPMFIDLWDSIHGECAWESNPWVWAISFKRVEAVAE